MCIELVRAFLMLLVLYTCPALAESGNVTCTGTLVDIDLDPKANFPKAVIYDTNGDYTCLIDRGHAGHDPLKPCHQGIECRLIGTYKKKIGQTYFIDTWMALCIRNDPYGDPACKF